MIRANKQTILIYVRLIKRKYFYFTKDDPSKQTNNFNLCSPYKTEIFLFCWKHHFLKVKGYLYYVTVILINAHISVGSFIYINSSKELAGKRARLSSPWQTRGKYCLSFWYYMYGSNSDILWIAYQEEKEKEKELLYLSKDQKKIWRFKSKDFTTEKQFKVYTINFNYFE